MKIFNKTTGQRSASPERCIGKTYIVCLAMIVCLFAVRTSYGQIAIASTTAVTQNFNSMATSGNPSLPSAWKASGGSATATSANPTYGSGTNLTATTVPGKATSVKTSATKDAGFIEEKVGSDLSIGFYTAESGTQYFGPNSIMAEYQNTHASNNITSLAVSYDIKTFQRGTAGAKIDFYYSFDGTNWIYLRQGSLDKHNFPTITNGGSNLSTTTNLTSLYSAPASKTASFTINGLNLAHNDVIYFRWDFSNQAAKFNNYGSGSMELALDNVSVTATMGAASTNPQAYITLSASSVNKGSGVTVQAFTVGGATVTGSQTVTVDVAQELVDWGDTVGGYTPAPSGTPVRSQITLTIPNGASSSGTVSLTPTDTVNTGNQAWIIAISDVTSGLLVSTNATNTPFRSLAVAETNDAILLGANGYTEDFNKLDTAYTEASSILPAGWYIGEVGTNGNGTYSADDGGQSTGNTFSYGVQHSSNRALGNYPTSLTKYQGAWGSKFKNNTGGTLKSVTIQYTGGQWSNFGDGNSNTINFYYSTSASSLTATNTTGWTSVSALNFTSPVNTVVAGGSILDGTQSANKQVLSATISGLSIANGGTFWIKWEHSNNASNKADALSIDDFSITATADPTSYFYTGSPGSDVTDVHNWNTRINGTGTNPSDFTTSNQLFNIRASHTLTSSWTVSGTNSKVVLGDSATSVSLTSPSSFPFSGTIDVAANAILTLQSSTNPVFGVLDNASTTIYDGGTAQNVLPGTYGNLTIQNNSATKTFPGNVTTNGTFTLNDVTVSAPGFIILTLNGNYTVSGTVVYSSNWRTNVRNTFGGSAIQSINTNAATRTVPMFGFNCTKTGGSLTIGASATVIDNSSSLIFDLHSGAAVFHDGGATINNGLHLEMNGLSDYSSYDLTGTIVMTGEAGSSNIEANTVPHAILAIINNLTVDTILSFHRAVASNGFQKNVTILNALGDNPIQIAGTLALNSGKLILSSTKDLMNTININHFTMINKNGDTTILNPGTKSNSSTGAPYSATINLRGDFHKSGSTDSLNASGGRLLLNFMGSTQSYYDDGNHHTQDVDFQVSAGTTVFLGTDLPVYPADSVKILNGGVLDLGIYKISDSASSGAVLHVYQGGRLRLASSSGLNAATNLTAANQTFAAGADYTFYNGGTSNTGFSGLTMGTPRNITDSISGTKLTLDASTNLSGLLKIYSGASMVLPDGNHISKSGSAIVNIAGTLDVNDANGYRGTSTGALQGFANSDITNTGTVRYVGTGAQVFTPNTYNNLTITGTGNKTLTGGNATVNGVLTLSSGNIKVVNDTLKLSSSGSVSGGSSASYVLFDASGTTGRMEQNFTGSAFFPIGDGYNPITINNPGTATTFDVSVADGVTDKSNAPLTDSIVNRTWLITPGITLTGVTVTPQWDNSTDLIGAGFDPASAFVASRQHFVTADWRQSATPGAANNVAGTVYDITSGGINMGAGNTYEAAVGSSVTELPVTLLTFTARKINNYAALEWKTASELNNNGFDIERNYDPAHGAWQKIAFVPGHGNSSTSNQYAYNDLENDLNLGLHPVIYYRLKQVDFNGVFAYSDIQAVKCLNTPFTSFVAYPNPVDNIANLSWKNSGNNIAATIKITDMMGKVVYTKNITCTANENMQYLLDMSVLHAGTYDIAVISGSNIEHLNMIKK